MKRIFLYKITFVNEGHLINPDITSPFYLESISKPIALADFIQHCRENYSTKELSPNKIKIKELTDVDKLLKYNQ